MSSDVEIYIYIIEKSSRLLRSSRERVFHPSFIPRSFRVVSPVFRSVLLFLTPHCTCQVAHGPPWVRSNGRRKKRATECKPVTIDARLETEILKRPEQPFGSRLRASSWGARARAEERERGESNGGVGRKQTIEL